MGDMVSGHGGSGSTVVLEDLSQPIGFYDLRVFSPKISCGRVGKCKQLTAFILLNHLQQTKILTTITAFGF